MKKKKKDKLKKDIYKILKDNSIDLAINITISTLLILCCKKK